MWGIDLDHDATTPSTGLTLFPSLVHSVVRVSFVLITSHGAALPQSIVQRC